MDYDLKRAIDTIKRECSKHDDGTYFELRNSNGECGPKTTLFAQWNTNTWENDEYADVKAPYYVIDVSKYIIRHCVGDYNLSISNIQLQQILYAVQRAWLRKFDKPIFDKPFEAWRYGPICPEAYYFFCGYGAMPIRDDCDRECSPYILKDPNRKIIDDIADKYKDLEVWDYRKENCAPGGAWDRTFNKGEGNKNIIMLKDIKKYG